MWRTSDARNQRPHSAHLNATSRALPADAPPALERHERVPHVQLPAFGALLVALRRACRADPLNRGIARDEELAAVAARVQKRALGGRRGAAPSPRSHGVRPPCPRRPPWPASWRARRRGSPRAQGIRAETRRASSFRRVGGRAGGKFSAPLREGRFSPRMGARGWRGRREGLGQVSGQEDGEGAHVGHCRALGPSNASRRSAPRDLAVRSCRTGPGRFPRASRRRARSAARPGTSRTGSPCGCTPRPRCRRRARWRASTRGSCGRPRLWG